MLAELKTPSPTPSTGGTWTEQKPRNTKKHSTSIYEIWVNLHSLVKFGIVAILLITGGLFAWKPASSFYRNWQLKKNTAAAARAFEEGDYGKARDLAKSVFSSRQDLGTLNILMRSAGAVGDPDRAEMARRYIWMEGGKEDNRLFAWRMVSANTPGALCRATWTKLSEEEKRKPEFILPWTQRLLAEDDADEVIRIISSEDTSNPQLERYLLDALALKGGTPDHIQLQTRLARHLQTGTAEDAILLGSLDSVPQDRLMPSLSNAAETWKARIDPDSISSEDRLRLDRLEIAAHPSLLPAKLSAALASAATTDKVVLAKWCVSLGKDAEAIELLAPVAKGGGERAYEMLSEIYLRTRRFADWNLLLDAPLGISLSRVHCDRAKIFQEKKDIKEQSLAEQRSYESANQERSESSTIALARHAGKLGLTDLSRRLWIISITRMKGPIPRSSEFADIFDYLRQKKDEDNLYAVYTSLCFMEPGNPLLLSEQLYLSCLRGQATPDQALKQLDEIASYGPQVDFRVSCAKAVCHLLLGDAATAAELTNQPVTWSSAPPHMRAIRGTALSLHGDAGEAAPLLKGLPWDDLLPSEKRIFSQLLKTKE